MEVDPKRASPDRFFDSLFLCFFVSQIRITHVFEAVLKYDLQMSIIFEQLEIFT